MRSQLRLRGISRQIRNAIRRFSSAECRCLMFRFALPRRVRSSGDLSGKGSAFT
jgi:hypothetical protein